MKNRPLKGDINYLSWQKKFTSVRTAFYFALVLAIFFMGLLTTGSRNNVLTVVAILGVLPASKSLVNTIMFVRYKGISDDEYNQIAKYQTYIKLKFNMIVSSSEKSTFSDCIAIYDHSVFIYVNNSKVKEKEFEKYLKNTLSNHGKGNVNVKIYTTVKDFTNRLSTLLENREDTDTSQFEQFENKVIQIIDSISL